MDEKIPGIDSSSEEIIMNTAHADPKSVWEMICRASYYPASGVKMAQGWIEKLISATDENDYASLPIEDLIAHGIGMKVRLVLITMLQQPSRARQSILTWAKDLSLTEQHGV